MNARALQGQDQTDLLNRINEEADDGQFHISILPFDPLDDAAIAVSDELKKAE